MTAIPLPKTRPDLPSRFEFRGALGRGGTGQVFEVFDHARGEVIALKTLDRLDSNGLLRIKHEFRVLSGITHPNLVTLHELHEHHGIWFITMERVEGVSFLRWIRGDEPPESEAAPETLTTIETRPVFTADVTVPERGPDGEQLPPATFDETRLRKSLVQLARALHAVHGAGRIHRDLKPSNVLVTERGRVVLLDFGIASMRDGHSDGFGTIGYMAPEQLGESPSLGAAADWYAVGVMIYEAMTGRRPFVGTASAVMGNKMLHDPIPPIGLVRGLSADLAALCAGLIQRLPEHRFGEADVFATVSERSRERIVKGSRSPPPLVGRADVLGAIGDAWRNVMRGPFTLEVRGPEGMGRSRLLAEAARQVGDEAFTVEIRCDLRESIPYRGVEQFVDALVRNEMLHRERGGEPRLREDARWLAEIFPVVWGLIQARKDVVVDPFEKRMRAIHALSRWVAQIAHERPMLVTIDDANGLDDDGLALLRALLNPPEPLPLLVVLATRVGTASVRLPRIQTIDLEPLGADDAQRVVEHVRGSQATTDTLQASEGRPGWLVALAEAHRHASSVDSLENVVRGRLETLAPNPRLALTLVALAYAPLDIGRLARAMNARRLHVAAWVTELRSNHLVRLEPRRESETIHPTSVLVRDAALRSLRDLPGYHRTLARSFEGSSDHHGACARHLEAAGEASRATHEALAGVALAEERLAFDRAAELCLLAARVDPQARSAHLARAGAALSAAGRGKPAAEAYLDAATTSEGEEAFAYRRAAASELLRSGHVDQGLETLREVLAEVGVGLPTSAAGALPKLAWNRLRLAMRRSWTTPLRHDEDIALIDRMRADACDSATALLNIDIYLGAHFQTLFLREALKIGEPSRLSRALAFEAPLLASVGKVAEAHEAITHARMLMAKSDGSIPHGFVDGLEGFALVQSGQWIRAKQILTSAHRDLRNHSRGLFWELVTLEGALHWTLANCGDLRRLRSSLHQTRAAAAARGDVFGATSLAVGVSTWAWLVEDEHERARTVHASAMEPWSRKGFHLQHFFHQFSEATVDLYTGEAERGWQTMREVEGRLRRSQLLRNQLLRISWLDLRARIALATSRFGVARSLARRIGRERVDWALPLASLLRASLAHASGGDPGTLLHEAARGFDSVGMRMHAAIAHARLHELTLGGQPLADSAWAVAERPASLDRFIASLAPFPRLDQ